MFVFFFKQKTAYEMRISDWSSDVCSSDLRVASLKELKLRINSVKSTQKITKAKKMVAAAKLRKAQAAAEAARPYAERLEGVVASLASKVGAADSAPKMLSGTGDRKSTRLNYSN